MRPISKTSAGSLLNGPLRDFKGLKPRKLGPKIYTPERGELVCELIASGFTISKVAEKVGTTTSAIYEWAYKHPDFCEMMIRARSQQAHVLMDRAYDQLEEHIARDDAKGGRQAVEGYIKIAEKLSPSKYGIRHVEYKGEIETKISEQERNLRILEILAKTSPELFIEHVPEAIQISAEPTRLLENVESRSGESAPEEVEAITECDWEVA